MSSPAILDEDTDMATQPTFTPGPWKSVEARDMKMTGEVIPVGVDVGGSAVRPLAWVPSLSSESAELSEQANADARLIAAAPDGLELAEDAVPILEALLEYREETTGEEDEILRDLLDRTKAFIAKATAA